MKNNLLLYLSLLYLAYTLTGSCEIKENFNEINNDFMLGGGVNEKIINLSDKKGNKEIIKKNTEKFGPACNSIYGKYNPRCVSNDKLNHVGYYTHKNTKYPVLDMKQGNKKGRYIMNGEKIIPFNQKHWDKVFYFDKPFKFDNNLPYHFIYNFYYSGKLNNVYINKSYNIYEKKVEYNLYKYVVFEKKCDNLKFTFSLPLRSKINHGDTVFIRHDSSTIGPFTFEAN